VEGEILTTLNLQKRFLELRLLRRLRKSLIREAPEYYLSECPRSVLAGWMIETKGEYI